MDCNVEILEHRIQDLEQAKDIARQWNMRITGSLVTLLIVLGGGFLTQYSKVNVLEAQMEKISNSITRISDGLGNTLDEQAVIRTEVAKNRQAVDALYVEIEDRKMYSVKNTDEINKLKEYLYKNGG